MPNPSTFEQEMLELINHARLDPQGEYERFIINSHPVRTIDPHITSALNYFDVDLAVYQQQLAGLAATAPLAWNPALHQAATGHSQAMIDQDDQQHVLPGDAGLGARISAAGYGGWIRLGENIFAYTESPEHGHAGFFIDWGFGPNGIQSGAGHRVNILNPELSEVGIGVLAEHQGATAVGPFVVTQDFGDRWAYDAQFVGVSYHDDDADGRYSMGEGSGDVTVVVSPPGGGPSSTATHAAGGYQIEGSPGLNTLTFSGGGLVSSVSVDLWFADDNVKVDLIDGDHIASSADVVLGDGAVDLTLLGHWATDGDANGAGNTLSGSPADNRLWGRGGGDVLDGHDGDDRLFGNSGNDVLDGGRGADFLHGGRDQDSLNGEEGADTLKGGKGNDTLHGGGDRDFVFGNRGDDVLSGAAGKDSLHGGQHDDHLLGGDGADTLRGGKGNDVLDGGPGADRIDGGPGVDWLQGGAGHDVFVVRVGDGCGCP